MSNKMHDYFAIIVHFVILPHALEGLSAHTTYKMKHFFRNLIVLLNVFRQYKMLHSICMERQGCLLKRLS
jgi:hypothetical protein